MQVNEAPRTLHGTETQSGYPSTGWIPIWTRDQKFRTRQPAGPAQSRADANQRTRLVEDSLDQAIRQLGAGSLLQARNLKNARKRELVARLVSGYPISLVCRLLDLPRSSYYYRPGAPRDDTLLDAVRRVMRDHPGYGYRRIAIHLRQDGREVSPKRVYLMMRRLRGLEA